MGKCFLHGNGGSNPLNFKVVGGTSEPSKPKPNMIWVNTDKKISGYHFSATEPKNIVEGDVWIVTGSVSSAPFNALKKNTLQVYPLYVKQYVEGVWMEKASKIYQNGKWVDWCFYFIGNGRVKGTLALKNVGVRQSRLSVELSDSKCRVTFKSEESGFGALGVVYVEEFESYDLTSVSEIVLEATFSAEHKSSDTCRLCVWNDKDSATQNNIVQYIDVQDGTTVMPAELLSGNYFIGIYFVTDNSIVLDITNYYVR